MTHRCLRAALVALTALIGTAAISLPALAQWAVYDAANHVQNVMTAARMLQQVNNEIKSLQNQAISLTNEAKNLASLPYSSLGALRASIAQTQQLLSNAQRIAYDVSSIDRAFTTLYPQGYSSGTSSAAMTADAKTRWQNALAGFQDAMRTQAGVVQNLDSTKSEIDALVSASQSASGALEATQSGNQLMALQTKQLADLTAVMASIARAQSLEAARTIESQAQAAQQRKNFLNYGNGYEAEPVEMFH
jgi:P-type conjugative transfer protein TrbJ